MRVIHLDMNIEVSPRMSQADAINNIKRIYPEVESYEQYTDTEGDIRFRASGGTKGCR